MKILGIILFIFSVIELNILTSTNVEKLENELSYLPSELSRLINSLFNVLLAGGIFGVFYSLLLLCL